MNARFYFQDPVLDLGLTFRSSHTVLHRVATSHTKSSPTNFVNFDKFYSVTEVCFHDPTLDMGVYIYF